MYISMLKVVTDEPKVVTNGLEVPANGSKVVTAGTEVVINGLKVVTAGAEVVINGPEAPATEAKVVTNELFLLTNGDFAGKNRGSRALFSRFFSRQCI